jgi:hypothetical protein
LLSTGEYKEGMSVGEGSDVWAPISKSRRGTHRLAGKRQCLY